MVKNPPAMWETWVRSLDWEDPLQKDMATHSSIPSLENPHGQRSLAGCKENRITQRLQNNFLNIDPDRTSAEEMKLLVARMGLVNGKPDLVHPWSKML